MFDEIQLEMNELQEIIDFNTLSNPVPKYDHIIERSVISKELDDLRDHEEHKDPAAEGNSYKLQEIYEAAQNNIIEMYKLFFWKDNILETLDAIEKYGRLRYVDQEDLVRSHLKERLHAVNDQIDLSLKDHVEAYEEMKTIYAPASSMTEKDRLYSMTELIMMADQQNAALIEFKDKDRYQNERKYAEDLIADNCLRLNDRKELKTQIMESAMVGLSSINPEREILTALKMASGIADETALQDIFVHRNDPENKKYWNAINEALGKISHNADILREIVDLDRYKDNVPLKTSRVYEDYEKASKASELFRYADAASRYELNPDKGNVRNTDMMHYLSDLCISDRVADMVQGVNDLAHLPVSEAAELKKLHEAVTASLLFSDYGDRFTALPQILENGPDKNTINILTDRAKAYSVLSEKSFFEEFPSMEFQGIPFALQFDHMPVKQVSMAMLYGLSKGHTLEELMAPENNELRHSMGDGFVHLLAELSGPDLTEESRNVALNTLGEMFKTSAEKLAAEKLPAAATENPADVYKAGAMNDILNAMAFHHSSLMNHLRNEPAFVTGLGGSENMKHFELTDSNISEMTRHGAAVSDPLTDEDQKLRVQMMTNMIEDYKALPFGEMDAASELNRKDREIRRALQNAGSREKEQLSAAIFHGEPMPSISGLAEYLPDSVQYQRDLKAYQTAMNQVRALPDPYAHHEVNKKHFIDTANNTMMTTMNRVSTRNSMAYLYIMAEHHMSLKEVMKLDAETVAGYTDEFVEQMEKHNAKDPVLTADQKMAQTRYFGRLYKSMQEALDKEVLPDIDLTDIHQMTEHGAYLKMISNLTKDYYQSQQLLKNDPGFIEFFGSRENIETINNRFDLLSSTIDIALSPFDQNKSLESRAAARYQTEHHMKNGEINITGIKIGDFKPAAEMKAIINVAYVPLEFLSKLDKVRDIAPENQRILDDIKNQLVLYDRGIIKSDAMPEFSAWVNDLTERNRMDVVKSMKEMETIDKYSEINLDITAYRTKTALRSVMTMGRASGTLGENRYGEISADNSRFLRPVMDALPKVKYRPEYQKLGIKSGYELIYIDGVRFDKYMDDLYPDKKQDRLDTFDGRSNGYLGIMDRELIAALTDGNHQVDILKYGENKDKDVIFGVTHVSLDEDTVRAYAKAADVPVPESSFFLLNTESRVKEIEDKIIADASADLYRKLTKEKSAAAMESNPYKLGHDRYDPNGPKVNDQYFGPSILDTFHFLSEKTKGTEVNFTSDYALLRNCAQLVTMAENENIRFADLMDPEKFQEQKMAAGRKVEAAFTRYFEGPESGSDYMEPAVGLIREAMGVITHMNVEKEILYAINADMSITDPAGKLEIMEAKENIPAVMGMMAGINAFAETAENTLKNQNAFPKLLAQTIAESDVPEYQNFRTAAGNLRLMDGDKDMYKIFTNYMDGKTLGQEELKEAQISRSMMDFTRSCILQTKEAYEINTGYLTSMKEQAASLRESVTLEEKDHLPSLEDIINKKTDLELAHRFDINYPAAEPEKAENVKIAAEPQQKVTKRSISDLMAEENKEAGSKSQNAPSDVEKWRDHKNKQMEKAENLQKDQKKGPELNGSHR